MSRRRKNPPPAYEAAFTLRLALRCPVDEGHPLGVIRRDVVGDHLSAAYIRPVWRQGDPDNNVPLRRDPPVPRRVLGPTWPNDDTAGRLRWTCPWCARAGLWEDRQVSYRRVKALLDAMRQAMVPELRTRLDPDELLRRVAELLTRTS